MHPPCHLSHPLPPLPPPWSAACSDGRMPLLPFDIDESCPATQQQIVEERRLFYVASTRARDLLHYTHMQRYTVFPGPRAKYDQPLSRFLQARWRTGQVPCLLRFGRGCSPTASCANVKDISPLRPCTLPPWRPLLQAVLDAGHADWKDLTPSDGCIWAEEDAWVIRMPSDSDDEP